MRAIFLCYSHFAVLWFSLSRPFLSFFFGNQIETLYSVFCCSRTAGPVVKLCVSFGLLDLFRVCYPSTFSAVSFTVFLMVVQIFYGNLSSTIRASNMLLTSRVYWFLIVEFSMTARFNLISLSRFSVWILTFVAVGARISARNLWHISSISFHLDEANLINICRRR